MLQLKGLRHAERFVREQRKAGKDTRWDGWDIVFFRPDIRGRTNTNGAFRNGAWGFQDRVSVNSEGIWEVDYRHVRRINRART